MTSTGIHNISVMNFLSGFKAYRCGAFDELGDQRLNGMTDARVKTAEIAMRRE